MHYIFYIFTLLFLIFTPLYAQENIPRIYAEIDTTAQTYQIDDIEFLGINVLDVQTVVDQLEQANIPGRINSDWISNNLRRLYDSGLFLNVDAKIDKSTNKLIFTLEERPTIIALEIEGASLIEEDDLKSELARNGIGEGEIFKPSTIDLMQAQVEALYDSQGRYGTRFNYIINYPSDNTVDILIEIEETDVIKIKSISFIGNNVYTNEELADVMTIKQSNYLSWAFRNDQYSRQQLEADIQAIESLYLDNGYLNIDISSVQVNVSPDKKDLYITFNIEEGQQYFINEYSINGNLIFSYEYADSIFASEKGIVYSQRIIQAKVDRYSSELENIGYLRAEVNVENEINDDNTVNVNYIINPGQQFYVRYIQFSGNFSTKDEVLRREMRQKEGSLAIRSLINLSEARLNRLGYFESVVIEEVPVPGNPQWIDLFITVVEQSRSSASAQISYSTIDEFIISLGYAHVNILGTGYDFSTNFAVSRASRRLSFNLRDPYFTKDGVSLNYRLFIRTTDFDEADIANYADNERGAGLLWGYPLSENQFFNFGVNFVSTEIIEGARVPLEIAYFLDNYGNEYEDVIFRVSHSYNTLNRGYLPTSGYSQSLILRATSPNSSLDYYEAGFNNNLYIPLTVNERIIWRWKSDIYYGWSPPDTHYPFYRYRFAGGIGSIRGFSNNSLGPRQVNQNGDISSSALGGNVYVGLSSEFIIPIPAQPQMRPVLFLDTAQVFNNSCIIGGEANPTCIPFTASEMRVSGGLGVTWWSPIGPMSFSYGVPIIYDEEIDSIDRVQFALGAAF